jgi:predicted transcriptional regulator
MTIAAICRKQIITVDEQASLRQAATLMREYHVGALVVTSSAGGAPSAVGIITDRDLAIEVLARDLTTSDVKAGELASRRLAAVAVNAGIGEAVAAMQRAGVRRLLVTEDSGEVAGIVSSDDLLEAIAGELGTLAGALRVGIARESTERPTLPSATPRPVFLQRGTPGWQA